MTPRASIVWSTSTSPRARGLGFGLETAEGFLRNFAAMQTGSDTTGP